MCTHVRKCKNDTCWNYSRNGGRRRWRRMVERGNSCMIYWYIIIICVNATMYLSTHHNNKGKKICKKKKNLHNYARPILWKAELSSPVAQWIQKAELRISTIFTQDVRVYAIFTCNEDYLKKKKQLYALNSLFHTPYWLCT
jgi:hypothetical protein